MQQRPSERGVAPIHTRRTQPALPGATPPTIPVPGPSVYYTPGHYEPQHAPQKRAKYGRRAFLRLLFLGLLIELLFLALYPVLAGVTSPTDVTKQAILAAFPWVSRFYWTTAFPPLAQLLASVPLFNPGTGSGTAHLLILLAGLAFMLVLMAGRLGNRVARKPLTRAATRWLLSLILVFTALFGLTLLFAPAVFPQDMLLYGLYGRLITIYHVNPYTVTLATFKHDLLHAAIPLSAGGAALPGPVWIDLCIPVALLAHDSIAHVIIGFRLMGLAAHLLNALLIWVILAKHKPEMRLFATLLYAWNPVVLLAGVNSMHLDIVLILFLLLGVFFFQRNSPILGWVFLLLAVLINMLCLLLLPLFFRLLTKHARALRSGRRLFWWLAIIGISCMVVVLAYLPYWQGWGASGVLASMQSVFLADQAVHSLDAALMHLPVHLPGALSWLLAPHHWMLLAALTVGCLLLLGMWLADTLELVILFSSWIWLALLVLLPVYWPWFILLPLALSLCSGSKRTILLAMLLALGALASLYALLWQPPWSGEALATVGLPLLLWGWTLFFTATWEMAHAGHEQEPAAGQQSRRGLSRPSWASRPWPSRPSRR